uniref:RING-type domain-containing protein n=1 Tax=Salarias fasciatus TaxID=181472 RepID=A0A672GH55_SALFA
MSDQRQDEKRYDRRDTTLKFVNRPDDLDPLPPEEGDPGLRAEMSCGHAVTPESLTGWCRSLLDQGQYKFKCPALKDGTFFKCGAVWPYKEVRRLAVLTAEEMQYFEENIARMAAAEHCEFKSCPGCKTYLERMDLTNLCVQLHGLCPADKKKVYQFCWQCSKPWKGTLHPQTLCQRGLRQPRPGAAENLQADRPAEVLEVMPVPPSGPVSPAVRGWSTTKHRLQEHHLSSLSDRVLLCVPELTPECLKTSTHFQKCSAGVAPKQTSIPVWRRN